MRTRREIAFKAIRGYYPPHLASERACEGVQGVCKAFPRVNSDHASGQNGGAA